MLFAKLLWQEATFVKLSSGSGFAGEHGFVFLTIIHSCRVVRVNYVDNFVTHILIKRHKICVVIGSLKYKHQSNLYRNDLIEINCMVIKEAQYLINSPCISNSIHLHDMIETIYMNWILPLIDSRIMRPEEFKMCIYIYARWCVYRHQKSWRVFIDHIDRN